MSRRGQVVARPLKKTEFTIKHASRSAADGWQNVLSTQRNAAVDAWNWLTQSPLEQSPTNYPLRDTLRYVVRDGKQFEQWQYKLSGGARIWFYVEEQVVHMVEVHTRHPNETK